MKNIKGKNALLTGGSRGLGPYIARALAREGVDLALTARSEEGLKSTADEINRLGVKTKIYPADITDHSSRKKLLDNVRADFGKIDLLINNAGMEWVSSYTSLTTDDIETMVQTNMVAPMTLTRMVLPDMIKQGSGHIATMSSLGGKKGSPYSATYAATKAGLIQWTHSIRSELRDTGVGASVICPGFVSEAGMFAVYEKRAPKILGETTPKKVAMAVANAIKNNSSEIIVNPGPVWPMMIMEAIHPDLIVWVMRKFGVYEFYKKQAEINERESSDVRTSDSAQ
jgi:short-subunit dehydrogenase